MNRSPFAALINMTGFPISIHHAAVISTEHNNETGGTHITLRIGDGGATCDVQTPYDEVMKELDRARRAEIMSFGE